VAFLLRLRSQVPEQPFGLPLQPYDLTYLCSLEVEESLLSDMTATHHFYGHNKPLPIVQILNDGSFFSFG